MKKLYNLYKEVILEATEVEMVMDAIDKHYSVNITYDNGKNDGTENQKRYCQVYNFGTTSDGNQAIRVYQVAGPNIKNKNGVVQRWKTFRLDRITSWEPTGFVNRKPITTDDGPIGFNPSRDITLNHGNLKLADFNNK